jgi:hypothetical protein
MRVKVIGARQSRLLFIIAWAGWLLGCSLLSRLVVKDKPVEPLAITAIASRAPASQPVAAAYERIASLPGYRLEREHVIMGPEQSELSLVVIERHDATGNVHLVRQTTDAPAYERYLVAGRSYEFARAYQGWVKVESTAGAEPGLQDTLAGGLAIPADPVQVLAQFGAAPGLSRPAVWHGRPANHYSLHQILDEGVAGFTRPSDTALSLSGALWVDQASGALLQSEITLTELTTGRLWQKHRVNLTDIGSVAPLSQPSPVVDPAAIVAATATAQSWSLLAGQMTYRGTPVTFEVIPLRVSQLAGASPLQAEADLMIRQLPDTILLAGNIDPFLAQLRHQLTISIPERNLIVTSSDYQLASIDQEAEATIRVRYTFNVNLEDFAWVELILAGPGNPQFAPVPVE